MATGPRREREAPARNSLFDATLARLVDAIARREWGNGEKLPAEVELAAHLGVSRPVLREVLRELERSGQIVRRHGAGTFVARAPRIETRLPTIISLELAAASVSTRVEEVVRTIELVTVGAGASPLELPQGEAMWRIERVKTVAGRRALALVDFLPGWLVPADRIGAELTTSVFDLVLAYAGAGTVNVNDTLHAETADAEAAGLLAVPEGTLLVTIVKSVRRPDGALIQHGSARHVASRFQFTVESELTTPWNERNGASGGRLAADVARQHPRLSAERL